MKKKIPVTLAIASAFIVLGYLVLQPKGSNSASTSTDPDRLDPIPDTSELAAEPSRDDPVSPEEQDLAVKLVETLHADKAINEVAIIQSVECADNRCTVELEAKGSANVQPTMLNFLQRHPEYGTPFKVAQGENPRVTQFTFVKEKM